MSDDQVPLNPAPDVRLTEHERELVKAVGFGLECERFVESNIGRYLFALANDVEMSCDMALRTVDPTNLRAIVDLQVKARAVGYLKQWIEDAVAKGMDAVREADASTD